VTAVQASDIGWANGCYPPIVTRGRSKCSRRELRVEVNKGPQEWKLRTREIWPICRGSWPNAPFALRQCAKCRETTRLFGAGLGAQGLTRGEALPGRCTCAAPVAIARARDPCGGAFIAGSLISRRWLRREGRTFRFHGWSRASCVQLVEVGELRSFLSSRAMRRLVEGSGGVRR